MSVLVGDIGGTKTSLAVAEAGEGGDRIGLTLERRYASAEFVSLADIVERFVEETGADCTLGSFAVAGPVVDDRSKTTNLPWELDARALAERLGFRRARLLNDLEAVAWGVAALDDGDLATLQVGEAENDLGVGNACVVAAGTGLGEAGLYWDGSRHHPFATEGGHTDFAPTDEREFALLNHLQKRFGRVSWERVVSGMGIGNLYLFLSQWHRAEHPAAVDQALSADGDLAAAVAVSAAAGCPVCAETMDLFALLYGREAGNMALKHMALGGAYLGGGIAPKNLDLLRRGGFMQGFLDKGRMRALMQRMPVRVILEQRTPLLGAARFALS
ncbi:MAG: glucokinase [Thiohalocapsa sp.]